MKRLLLLLGIFFLVAFIGVFVEHLSGVKFPSRFSSAFYDISTMLQGALILRTIIYVTNCKIINVQ